MKKRFLAFLFAAFFLISLSAKVLAVETTDELLLKKAVIVEKEEECYLEITAENATNSGLYSINCYVIAFDEEALAFQDSSVNAYGYIMASLSEIDPRGSATFLFELKSCTDPFADLDIGFNYRYASDTVYAGDVNNEKNYGECSYFSVLKEEKTQSSDQIFLCGL